MHLFVTGGTGFFGRALLKHWASEASECAGARFTLLSRNPDRFRVQNSALLEQLDVHLVRGDILHPETLPQAGSFTHILHGATDSTRGLGLKPIERYLQIADGTRNALNMARAAGVGRVLVVSSGGVYGPQPGDMAAIPEDYTGMPDPMNPDNAYSVAKRGAEHLAALYQQAYGVESVVARCFAFVGPDLPRDAHFAIGNFLADVLENREIVVNGDGTPLRSYLDQRDLAVWLCRMLLRGTAMRAYNVGSDEVVSISDLARLVSRLSGAEHGVRVLGEAPRGQAVNRNRYIPDISRARVDLGLNVTIQLERAIAETLEALRAGASR